MVMCKILQCRMANLSAWTSCLLCCCKTQIFPFCIWGRTFWYFCQHIRQVVNFRFVGLHTWFGLLNLHLSFHSWVLDKYHLLCRMSVLMWRNVNRNFVRGKLFDICHPNGQFDKLTGYLDEKSQVPWDHWHTQTIGPPIICSGKKFYPLMLGH